MRVMFILLWVALVLVLLLPLARWLRRVPLRGQPRVLPDELVKDPVCGVYVVRSRAVTRHEAGEPRYYCSRECARRAAAS